MNTEIPVVLFPVRIETRFERGPPAQLLVRVYPDEILADGHEPPLTAAERDAGVAYWKAAWPTGNEQPSWQWIVTQFPATRAAWIVTATTPTNLADRPAGEPRFPELEIRSGSWTRAVYTKMLPDRWLVIGYRNDAEACRAIGKPIQSPLPLTFSPGSSDENEVVVSDNLRIDPGIVWTIDFDQAEAVGMSLRVPLRPEDLQLGLDRLIVVGLKESISAKQGAREIEKLLVAHHYSNGLAFVSQGTPTNNTTDAPTTFPPADPDGAYSFGIERGAPLASGRTDRDFFTRALGLSRSVIDHVGGLRPWGEQEAAQAMNNALWPATLGYFLEQMMAPLATHEAILQARSYFLDHVRGRGPFPAFRIGETPYGLVPVSSLARWSSRPDASGIDVQLPQLLQIARQFWDSCVKEVPGVGQSQDPDGDLLRVLGLEASTVEVRVRQMLGPDLQKNLMNFLGVDSEAWSNEQQRAARLAMAKFGHPEWNPRILGTVFSGRSNLFSGPLVTDRPLSEEEGPSPFNYVEWIRTASFEDLKSERFPEGTAQPSSLLYRILRHAMLAEYARVGFDIVANRGLADEVDRREPELIGIVPEAQIRPTILGRLGQPIPSLTGNQSLGGYLSTTKSPPETAPIQAYRNSLQILQTLPTAELERLFTETLDVCSHRLDAWITSLATRRLKQMRDSHPLESYIGAYGWVESLRPASEKSTGSSDQTGSEQVGADGRGGYIHAPSMNHAAAAAILRSAYLTRSSPEGGPYAINLSSNRVRVAERLLDGVREGQPLGGTLGYLFERGLHEGHPSVRLDRFVAPLRQLFPLSGEASPSGSETLSSRNVVDGLALCNAWRSGKDPLAALQPSPTSTERQAMEVELLKLDESVDSIADLLTAESVYQVIRGNKTGAAASLDSLSQGVRPPEAEIAKQPRSGTPLFHRVAVVLGGEQPMPSGPWRGPSTPRALAEPFLDAWVGSLLGDPRQVVCRVDYPEPVANDAGHRGEKRIRLSDLDLRPLDFVALARGVNEVAQASELDLRVVNAALGLQADLSDVNIVYAPDLGQEDGNDARTFAQELELARAINAMLGTTRPLRRQDFVTPGSPGPSDEVPEVDSSLANRAMGARTFLNLLATDLRDAILRVQGVAPDTTADITDLRKLQREASLFGVPGSYPLSLRNLSGGPAVEEQLRQSVATLAELNRRLSATSNVTAPEEILHVVFGRAFLVLPRFRIGQESEVTSAMAHGALLVGSPLAVRKWFQQLARVRGPLARWRMLSLYVNALNGPPMEFEVAQLPHSANERWAALPFEPETPELKAGKLSIAIHNPGSATTGEAWVGLVLDEWTELVPSQFETTGIAFQYDAPASTAPQAVLVAVPPKSEGPWDLDTLADIVRETLDLARLRGVDSDLLGELGQILPAIYLATNDANKAIATQFPPSILRASPLALSSFMDEGSEGDAP